MSEYGLTVKRKTESKIHLRSSGKPFHNYYDKADRMPGQTGANLMILLESRLDNVVFRMGLQEQEKKLVRLLTTSMYL